MPEANQQAALDRAVDALDLILTERGWGEAPALLRLRGGLDPDAGAELAVRPLDGHPAQALLGFSTPMGWTAIGVSAEGWASHNHSQPTGYSATSNAGEIRRRVRIITLLDRDGTTAGRLRSEDGSVIQEAPSEGLVIDCLRRALGLRTLPPTASTESLFTALWLEAIAGAAGQERRAMTWDEAIGLHPAVHLLARDGHAPGHDEVITATRALGSVCNWTQVRQAVIRGWKVGVDAPLAVWMDAGMLSRWLLDQHPPMGELTARARRRCTRATMRQVIEVLNGLGLADGRTAPQQDIQPGAA